MIHRYYNVNGEGFKEAISIHNKSLVGEAKFWIKVKAHKEGDPNKPVPFKLVVFDAEATSLKITNNFTEDINFIDFGKGFNCLKKPAPAITPNRLLQQLMEATALRFRKSDLVPTSVTLLIITPIITCRVHQAM